MSNEKIRLVILKNELPNDHLLWLNACEHIKDFVEYLVVDMSRNNWLENITKFHPNILLTKPTAITAHHKQLYDERLTILAKELSYNCFPNLDEVMIYENKRYLSYWLKAHKIPHPITNVYYHQDEAVEFIKSAVFPLVGKVNIGASGSGVRILKNEKKALDYVNCTFSGKGASKRNGPNFNKRSILKRGFHYVLNPGDIAFKIKTYKARIEDVQNHFVILQEYVPHDFEWRVVRIGSSFFAHKKLKIGEKASGSLKKNYDNPSLSILDFVKEITDRFGFYSQAIDIFETKNEFLVNEMQCLFGQSDPYQMLVNGKPGRYLHSNGEWIFEEGHFNQNESYDIRLKAAINKYLTI